MNTKYFSKFAVLFLFFQPIAWAEKPLAPESLPGITRVDAEMAAELIVGTANLVVIDSRKDIEYSKGHIQGSVSLLDTDMTFESLAEHVPDETIPVLFYCNGKRCLRSSRAAIKALDWGYKEVYWFRGGWNEWVDKGMPISR